MSDPPQQVVIVAWVEVHNCEHHFTLNAARAFASLHGAAELAADATPEQIVAALHKVDVEEFNDALAEIDQAGITTEVVRRRIHSVELGTPIRFDTDDA